MKGPLSCREETLLASGAAPRRHTWGVDRLRPHEGLLGELARRRDVGDSLRGVEILRVVDRIRPPEGLLGELARRRDVGRVERLRVVEIYRRARRITAGFALGELARRRDDARGSAG